MQSAISDLTIRMATGFTGVADGPDESLVDAWRPIRSRIDPTVAARDGTSRADRNAGEAVVRTGVVSPIAPDIASGSPHRREFVACDMIV